VTSIADFVEASREAATSSPSASLSISPAGLTIRINLAGSTLIDQLQPGLLTGEGEPVAELHAFDSAGTGVAPPSPPWPTEAFKGERSEIAGFNDPPQLATYDQEYATLSFYDEDAAAGVQWFRDAGSIPPWEGGAPLRNLIRWALAPHGAHMIHAASVGGALITGPGGAGKSTTSLACALAGLPFTSDDFSVITTNSVPTAHACFAYAKATPETYELLPALEQFATAAQKDWRGKSRLKIASRITRSQEISAIVLLARAEKTGKPRKLDPPEALRRISAGNLTLMPGATSRTLAALAELVAQLPAYELAVGPDVAAIPEAIAAL
jgi:hypothetical protein